MKPHYSDILQLGGELYVISVDAPEKSKVEVVEALGVQFAVLSDQSRRTIRSYGVDGGIFAIPSAFVIDKSGIIRYKSIGNTSHRVNVDTLIEQLEKLNLESLRSFSLTLPSGASLFHLPNVVTEVNGESRSVTQVSDLFEVLGGESNVNWLITTPAPARGGSTRFQAFFRHSDADIPANATIQPYTGILVHLRNRVEMEVGGDPVEGAIQIIPGPNLVGIPNRDTSIKKVSDFARFPDFLDRISLISIFKDGKFHPIEPHEIESGALDDDPEIVPGQAFVVVAKQSWFPQF